MKSGVNGYWAVKNKVDRSLARHKARLVAWRQSKCFKPIVYGVEDLRFKTT